MKFDTIITSQHFTYYHEKFFVAKLWQTLPHSEVLKSFNDDQSITEQEREYFKKEYSEFLN